MIHLMKLMKQTNKVKKAQEKNPTTKKGRGLPGIIENKPGFEVEKKYNINAVLKILKKQSNQIMKKRYG